MRVVLVTGGAGFIGSNFVRYMLKRHPECRIVNLDARRLFDIVGAYKRVYRYFRSLNAPDRILVTMGERTIPRAVLRMLTILAPSDPECLALLRNRSIRSSVQRLARPGAAPTGPEELKEWAMARLALSCPRAFVAYRKWKAVRSTAGKVAGLHG